jgi:serine/threonine protein kinase
VNEQSIKHYAVEGTLGKGGMGIVYRARDTRLQRPVALKVLPPEVTSDPERRQRFVQEARAASAVNHPAIAQIYDVDETPEGIYIAMELIEGRTVRSLLQSRELDLLGALEVGIQVAGGLGKAHEAGIVHRDIKPENVMVTPDGHAKILDFGLAKRMDTSPPSAALQGDELSRMETVARTQAGMVIGTLRYMSPEQARGRPVDQRSDIFSLGVVIYEMVTGQIPFSGATPLDQLHAIAFEETQPVTALRAYLPASLQRVIARCLRKRPEDRYPEARELAADLKSVQREVESGISQKTPLGERIKEGLRSLREMTPGEWAAPLGLASLALIALVVLLARSHDLFPSLVLVAIVGAVVYRRIRNRRSRFLRRFAAKVRKMPEVRMIVAQEQKVTVVADQALAKTYVRINALMDSVNSKMYFGEPLSVVVRDNVTPDEVKQLLAGTGVIFVRDDVVGK